MPDTEVIELEYQSLHWLQPGWLVLIRYRVRGGRAARRQTLVGRAGVSLSSVGEQPAGGHESAANGVALLQRPG